MLLVNASLAFLLVTTPSGMDGRMASLRPDEARYQTTAQEIETWDRAATTCEDPALVGIVSQIDSFEEPFKYWEAAASLVAGVRQVAYQYGFWHSDLALKAAHVMVPRCPQVADMVYRHILEMYSAPAYESVRDRAKVGIEDVRWAKENASNP